MADAAPPCAFARTSKKRRFLCSSLSPYLPLHHSPAGQPKQHRGILQNTDMFSVFFSFYLLTNDMEALIMNIVHIEVIT